MPAGARWWLRDRSRAVVLVGIPGVAIITRRSKDLLDDEMLFGDQKPSEIY